MGGSVTERRDGREKLSNTCPVYDPHGELVGLYRKIHMFDVEVGGQVYRESEAEEPGEEPVVCEAEGWKLGLTVCYDLRFPELFRIEALEGAELITVPAAFTLFTGKDHWELLLRARAVENQLYVAASNQWGETAPGKSSYGRSLIVDPWGIVLAAAPDEDCVISAELDRARLERVRASLPSLANRQPNAYRWPALTPRPAGAPARRSRAPPRLTPLAAGCGARVAWSYVVYCPARRSLASLASDLPVT